MQTLVLGLSLGLGAGLAPGQGFGARGEGWARLSLAIPDEDVAEAAERLRRIG